MDVMWGTMLSMDLIVRLHIIYDVVIFVYAIVNEQRIMNLLIVVCRKMS